MVGFPAPQPLFQRGLSTLLISILLLLIASIIVLFSASVNFSEVRTGGNNYRSLRAFDSAQQAVNLGIEYLRENRSRIASTGAGGWLEPDLEQWELCPAAGAAADDFPCNAEPDSTKRSRMWRYRGGIAQPVEARYRLPIPQPLELPEIDRTGDGGADANDPDLRYRVGALLCLVVPPDPAPPGPPPAPECAGDPIDPIGGGRLQASAFAVTVVARAAVMSADAEPDDLPETVGSDGRSLAEARSTIAHVYSSYRLVSDGPEAPLIAANQFNLTGTFDIVPNPNAGGFGIPISIWSGSMMDWSGTSKTCHRQDFFASSPDQVEEIDGILVCDQCQCPNGGSITYKDQGNWVKGRDILDSTGNNQITGAQNFPDDLFQYLFGVPKLDAAGNARWTEVRDRSTLLGANCSGDDLSPTCCADLGRRSSGLFWADSACAVSQSQVGTPLAPILLVAEQNVTVQSELLFGVVFKFSRPGDGTVYDLRLNGGGTLYGAYMVDDNGAGTLNGNFALVYDADVMRNLANAPGFLRLGPLPGSWTDLTATY